MTELTDELIRRRLTERAATGSAPSLAAIARAVAASPAPRSTPWSGRWAVLSSFAASMIVTVALVGGLLNRTGPPAVAPSNGVTTSPPASASTASPATGSVAPVPPEAAGWTSIAWMRVSAAPFAVTKETQVTDAIALGDGFLAIGYDPDASPVAGHLWTSPDGRGWTRVDGDWLVGLIPDEVVRVGDRLALLGRRDGPGENDPTELWISEDGVSWTQGPSPAGATGYAEGVAGGSDGLLARFDGRTFTIGVDLRSWAVSADRWAGDVALGRPADANGMWIQPGATGMGDAGAIRTGAIWTSRDGATWSPAALADPGGAVNHIYRVEGGWVAIGSPSTFGCRPCFGPIDATRIAWFSVDGRSWTRVREAGSSGNGTFFGAQFVGDGHRLVAILPGGVGLGGSGGSTEELRETVDGTTWTSIAVDPAVPALGESDDGIYVGRHGLVALPGGIRNGAGMSAWWGEATSEVIAPSTSADPSASPLVTGCDTLGFNARRCAAVVARARNEAGDPTDVITIVIGPARLPIGDSAGSHPLATVGFTLADGTTKTVDFRCMNVGTWSDLACADDPQVYLLTGVSHDVPCPNPCDDNHPGATPPPSPKPAVVAASTPLVVPAFDVPIDHLGHYELLVGDASLPDGLLSERSGTLGDPRPTAYWIDRGVQIVVRPGAPCIGVHCPEIDSIYHAPFHGPQPVHVYLVFDVTELDTPGAILEVRNLVVR